MRFADFVFTAAATQASEEAVHLTDRERDMLRMLADVRARPCRARRSPGVAARYERAASQVNRLRRKVERDPANPLIVQTVRGIGYRLMVAP